MGGMEFNKIFAAVLVAGIIAMLAGFIANTLTRPHPLHENAYKIEGVVSAEGGASAVKLPEPILSMIATADVERGQKVAKACAACHSFEKGGPNGVGPDLYNVLGRVKQSAPGFTYSGSLNSQGGNTWTYGELNKFLWKPKAYAPDTKMTFIGIKKPEDRAAVIAWLHTLSDSPKPMPSAVEIATEQAELGMSEEDGKAVNEAIDTVKEGISAEKKDLNKAESDAEKSQAGVDEAKVRMDDKKQEVKEAADKIHQVVKDAH